MKYSHTYLDKLELIGFEKTHRKIKGVYCFGENYVGGSLHIRQRLIQHLRFYFIGSILINPFLKEYLDYCFSNNKKPQVYFVSENPYDEKHFTSILGTSVLKNAKFYCEKYK